MGRRNVLVRRFEITRASQAYIDITTKILVLERPAWTMHEVNCSVRSDVTTATRSKLDI